MGASRKPDKNSQLQNPVKNPVLKVALREGTRRGVMIGGTHYRSPSQGEGFTLDLLDFDVEEAGLSRLRLPFLAHGFAPHPKQPERAVLLEKWGHGGAFVDLVEKSILKQFAPKAGHQFYGHGVFAETGDVLFAVETHLETREGRITVRDAETFAVLGEFPSYGQKPHDCMLIDSGNVLAITNGGGPFGTTDYGCVTFVSITDQRLLEKRDVGTHRLNTGHIAMTLGGDFVTVSAPREGLPEATTSGGVNLCVGARRMTHMNHPPSLCERIVGEALSACIHEPSGHVVVTHPFANLVSIWHLPTKRFVRELELVSPRGVALTLDGSLFVISYGAEASTLSLDATTLEQAGERGRAVFGGSHIYTWAYPAKASAS